MKALITGGYGFIGSHVAEKLYKEGYEIHILDNLSRGTKQNINFKHKSYVLSTDDSKCQQIFSSYQFDVVIHLAGHSTDDPLLDVQANVVGLVNILQLVKKYNVKKFIYTSTTDVYDSEVTLPIAEGSSMGPSSSYGISNYSAETYCQNYLKDSKIDIVCFRLSNVYGPRQLYKDGVIPHIIHHAIYNKPNDFHLDSQHTRDFIYINDVVIAIFRACQSILSGTYNLCSSEERSILEVANIVNNLKNDSNNVEIHHDTKDAVYTNEKLKRDFDWVPYYSLEEGITKTYEWAVTQSNTSKNRLQGKTKLSIPAFFRDKKPYAENIGLFLIASTLIFLFPLQIISTFIFCVFYIMIVGSIYGNKQGFVAVVLSVVLILFENLRNGRELLSLMYDTNFLFQIATFLFIGLVIGYSAQRKNLIITEKQGKIEEFQKRYEFLEDIYTEMREIKDELQFRLRNNEDSFGKIYSIIKDLDNLEPEKVFTKTVQVVEQILHCKGVCIYTFNKNHSYLRLIAHSNKDYTDGSISNSISVSESEYIQDIIETGKPFFNYLLDSTAPLMAAPIYYNNDLHAIITIDQLPFESFSKYHENLFIVVKDLIQTSLSRAFEFIKISDEKRFIENTSALRFEIFNEIIQTKEEAKNKSNMPYIILTMYVEFDDLKNTVDQVSRLLRETDYISYNNEMLYILLSNTKESDLPLILNRFIEANFTVNEPEKVV